MAGWYAQKHPDEDFAETFAVWLTPRSNWRKKYKGWGAMRKLQYMDRIARKVGGLEPLKSIGDTDITVEEMETTVGEFYDKLMQEQPAPENLALDNDLLDIFKVSRRRQKGVRSAADLLRENRKALIDKVNYWSGVQRPLIKKLVENIITRISDLGLKVEVKSEPEALTEVTAYITALAMNYLSRGKFVQP